MCSVPQPTKRYTYTHMRKQVRKHTHTHTHTHTASKSSCLCHEILALLWCTLYARLDGDQDPRTVQLLEAVVALQNTLPDSAKGSMIQLVQQADVATLDFLWDGQGQICLRTAEEPATT